MELLDTLCTTFTQLKGTEEFAAPSKRTLGIPQRAYGYTTEDVEYLQTSNLNYCISLIGKNERGAFLGHIDYISFDNGEVPEMMANLDRVLHGPFDITLIYNKGQDKRQDHLPTLKKQIKHFQRTLTEKRKGKLQTLDLGVDRNGRIYHPISSVTNQTVDELEECFSIRRGEGKIPLGYYRENLGCVNQAKGIIIPPEAFTEEQIPKWMGIKGMSPRAEVMAHLTKLFNLTPEDYVKLAKGRRYDTPQRQGALVMI